ncbi:hypothetical protein HELRODRAFT_189071 [Helobdella robusta]|uniref:TOG domain-containing protein n=1 Tax=Helobdella robusta TaxID=6412 RepID=T1FQM1_HELRO|nr:hypothetical protein HELRODRAFT_189071 [Helobdella robusta]ESN96016.1 hypothetical protein HELRODRAFT_189071 [Helobdella robusta]
MSSNHRSLKSPSPFLFKKPGRSNSVDQNNGIDKEQFEKSFDDTPSINIYSPKDVVDRLSKIKECINNPDLDWEKRTFSLKELRFLTNNGHLISMSDLTQQLRFLDIGLQTSLKDLRSQVVREACITIACMSKELEVKFESSSELLLPILIGLMQNTAKVMANSAVVCIKFLLKYIHSPRLIATIATNLTSKSNIIRKFCCEFIWIVLSDWSKVELERQVTIFQEFVKKGLVDADADARMHARKAFASFSMHFPELGFTILSSFDASKQKQLLAELDDPGMFNGMTMQNRAKKPSTPSSTLIRTIPRTLPKSKISQSQPSSRSGSPNRTPLASKMAPPDITNNSNCKIVGSSSISSNANYLKTLPSSIKKGVTTPVRKFTCQSQGNSRDTSPERRELKYNGLTTIRRGSESTTPSQSHRKQQHQLTHQRIEDYGRDLEAAVTGAWRHRELRRSQDDESSSICSESSFRSYSDLSEDVVDIINSLTIASWSDRKDGLIRLQRFLRSERRLSLPELKRLTEVLTRMFHDPHPKVLTQFLETLVDLLYGYSCDLINWLPIILNRLISKSGSDVLGSLQAKIAEALNTVKETFPEDNQLSAIMRFIVEQQQTINIRIKSSILKYLLSLLLKMEPNVLANNSDARLAVSKIVTWTSEPKSAEVRKASQAVLLEMHERNSVEFSKIVSALPKSFQDSVRKVFLDVKESTVNNLANGNNNNNLWDSSNQFADRKRSLSRSSNPSPNREAMRERQNYNYNHHHEAGSRADGWNDVFDGIRKTTEDIQQLSLRGACDEDDGDEGIGGRGGGGMFTSKNNNFNTDTDYDYFNKDLSKWENEDLGALIDEIRSCDNIDEWCRGMSQLANVAKFCENQYLWEVHFRMVLLLLLESMQDQENSKRRCCSLRVMKELLEKQHLRFQTYAELTVMNLLEFEKDTDRDVQKSADDCTSVLSRVIPTDQLVSILNPITITADYPMNLAAIKLETKVVQNADAGRVKEIMEIITPGLVKGFENNESSVRKASMTCLLAIYKHVHNDLMPLLTQLNPNKMKLLNLYIKRESDDIPAN